MRFNNTHTSRLHRWFVCFCYIETGWVFVFIVVVVVVVLVECGWRGEEEEDDNNGKARLGCVINRIQLENCVILDWWWAFIHKIVSHCSQYLHCWIYWFSVFFLSISIFNDTTNANWVSINASVLSLVCTVFVTRTNTQLAVLGMCMFAFILNKKIVYIQIIWNVLNITGVFLLFASI